MKRQDCEYCGKKGAGYAHVRLCSLNPKKPQGDVVAASTPIEEDSDTKKP